MSNEPLLLGYPVTLLFLYFVLYSFLGWALETTYCSIQARKPVSRGFLRGPVCPIYGMGVLMMILFFKPLADNFLVFYLVSTVTMSTWEYLVAWLLESVTRIKYWDYSNFRFHLHGRICLWICLVWGLLSFVCIFWIHPFVEGLLARIPGWLLHCTAGGCAALLTADAADTILGLAQTTLLMQRLESVGGQLQVKLSLGKLELDESAEHLKARYNDLLATVERRSRRFRNAYTRMSSSIFSGRLEEVKQTGADLAARLKRTTAAWRTERRKK